MTRTALWMTRAVLPDGVHEAVRVVAEHGVITTVVVGGPPEPGDRRLTGVVLPGFADAHSHAFHRALRGRTHRGSGGQGSFWTWRELMYRVAAVLEPDVYEDLATALFAEMALAGITRVGEFHYVHHDAAGRRYDDPNAMGRALRRAAGRAGIRLTLLDTCYLASGTDEPLSPVQRRFSDGDAAGWVARVRPWSEELADEQNHDAFVLGAAVHSVRAVPPPDLAVVAAWARARGLPLHVHLSEQVAENDQVRRRYGTSPTRVLEDVGALGPDTTVVHAVHLQDEDVALLGERGVCVCACPVTERDLGDGIAPNARLLAAGARLCVGTDQHVSTDVLAEARGIEEHERLAARRRGVLDPSQVLAALTVDGHASLGRPRDGRIAVGAAADLVALDPDSPRTAGCAPDQLVMVAGAADVRDVVVGGDLVVEGGRHRLGDVGGLLTRALAALGARVDEREVAP